MRICLLTIWRERNYGAELQAYATVKVLQSMGHDVKMIDIRLSDCKYRNFNGRIAQVLEYFGPAQRSFRRFWKQYIPTTRRYKTVEALQANPPQADVYLVGSDQVWNPELTGAFSKLYFLNFGADNVKRVSYASSFGTAEWKHPDLTAEVTRLLRRFNHVTCRETTGVELLKNRFGIEATNVIDPTLLLANYSDLIGSVSQRDTLVYYPLSSDPELEQYAEQLADKLHLTAVNNKKCSYLMASVVWRRVSIEQWIRNIAEARFVITRSFHGMVFAILHQRQFAVVGDALGRSTRLQSLLHELGLSDRFYPNLSALDAAEPWRVQINYDEVAPRLERMRQRSINILRESIES
jgi:polysaccharide pyruvyl transferase WcaK-like protein